MAHGMRLPCSPLLFSKTTDRDMVGAALRAARTRAPLTPGAGFQNRTFPGRHGVPSLPARCASNRFYRVKLLWYAFALPAPFVAEQTTNLFRASESKTNGCCQYIGLTPFFLMTSRPKTSKRPVPSSPPSSKPWQNAKPKQNPRMQNPAFPATTPSATQDSAALTSNARSGRAGFGGR